MDWLLARQSRIETALAGRHLAEGSLVFYDVSSTWFEGRHCPLARLGHARDGKRGKLQIVFGLLVNAEGCPVAVEVFSGDTGDPKTLASQVAKLRERFGLKRLVLVGDRGMITDARIREDLQGVEGLSWITALRAPAIQELVRQGSLQLSLFDEKDLAEISSPDYPDERLIVCKNPLLAEERARKRKDLLRATEKGLDAIVEATHRKKGRLKDPQKIAFRIGKVLGRFKVGKHFLLHVTEEGFRHERDAESIAREAALDGFYVIRTSVPAEALSSQEAVRAYKGLSRAERAFRSLKTVDLKVRPINHRLADRVRAHVFLCMLAYYVEWHVRRALAPLLFDDEHPEEGEARRASVVAPAQRSSSALEKALTKRTEEGLAVHSFQSLLRDLATVTKNRVRPRALAAASFDLIATPTPLQRRAFELLGVDYRM
jgi:transposase